MKHKYTAKVISEEGEVLLQSGDDVEELMAWIYAQGEAGFGEITGEIIENETQKVIKAIEYTPPSE